LVNGLYVLAFRERQLLPGADDNRSVHAGVPAVVGGCLAERPKSYGLS
jgi:hypothetical protein